MIELKVRCDCGQKFKFDVEPVGNRMPFTVACPVCGADGTEKANALLQQMTVFKLVEPPPGTAPGAMPPPPPVSQPTRIRLGSSVQASRAPPPLAPPTPPPIGPVSSASGPVSRRGTSFAAQAAAQPDKPGRKPSFALGLLGGFLGALIGATIYYAIFRAAGLHFGFMARMETTLVAIGIGGLAGWAAEFLGRGEGSKELGLITAIVVVASIIGAQYLVALGWWHQLTHEFEDAGYSAVVAEAKEVVKAVPTGSDAEIRNYLAKDEADEDAKPDSKAVSDDEVKQFRQRLPEFQDLASGKETKEQYFAKNGIDPNKVKKAEDTVEDTFQSVFLLLLVSKVGIFSLIASAGLAYKLCTNA